MPTQIYYISSLNQESALDACGNHIGSIEAQGQTDGTTVTDGFMTITNCKAAFKFYTTPNSGDGDLPSNNSGQEGSATWTAKNKDITTFTNGTIGTDASGSIQEVIQALATAVFGSPESVDFFSNASAIKLSITDSFTNLLNRVNSNIENPPVVALGNAMIYNYPERFTLQYTATGSNGVSYNTSLFKNCKAVGAISGATADVDVTLDASGSIGVMTVTDLSGVTVFVLNEEVAITDPLGKTNLNVVANSLSPTDLTKYNDGSGNLTQIDYVFNSGDIGVYTQIAVSGDVSGNGALCTCRIASGGGVASIYVTTDATTAFADLEALTFTNGAGVAVGNVTIAAANPVQVAMLNGTLDDSNGTSLPFESGDTIRTMYTFNANASQLVAGTSDVAIMDHKMYMDFVIA